jgi:hypothetical protein
MTRSKDMSNGNGNGNGSALLDRIGNMTLREAGFLEPDVMEIVVKAGLQAMFNGPAPLGKGAIEVIYDRFADLEVGIGGLQTELLAAIHQGGATSKLTHQGSSGLAEGPTDVVKPEGPTRALPNGHIETYYGVPEPILPRPGRLLPEVVAEVLADWMQPSIMYRKKDIDLRFKLSKKTYGRAMALLTEDIDSMPSRAVKLGVGGSRYYRLREEGDPISNSGAPFGEILDVG